MINPQTNIGELEEYQIEESIYSKKVQENNLRIDRVISRFLNDEITMEDLLSALQDFAEEKCVNMLELEEKVRVAIFDNLAGPLNSPYMRNLLSGRLHEIVNNWYRIRIEAGDETARKEFYNYKFMIGHVEG